MSKTTQSIVRRLIKALVTDKSPLNRSQYLIALIGMVVTAGWLVFLEFAVLPYCGRLNLVFGQIAAVGIDLVVAASVAALFCLNYIILRARLRDFRVVDESRLETEAVALFICMFVPGLSILVVAYLLFSRGLDDVRRPLANA